MRDRLDSPIAFVHTLQASQAILIVWLLNQTARFGHGGRTLNAIKPPRRSANGFTLLDPLEEQFNLPTALVELGNHCGGQVKVVCQKDQDLTPNSIVTKNPAQPEPDGD